MNDPLIESAKEIEVEALRAKVAALKVQREQYKGAAENLGEQVASLTRAVDTDYEQLYREVNGKLAAAQAREAKRIGELSHIRDYWNGSRNDRAMHDALTHIGEVIDCVLALPADDTALQERLKAERGRWEHAANEWADTATNAKAHIENIRDGISTPDRALENLAECFKHNHEVVDAIRSMK